MILIVVLIFIIILIIIVVPILIIILVILIVLLILIGIIVVRVISVRVSLCPPSINGPSSLPRPIIAFSIHLIILQHEYRVIPVPGRQAIPHPPHSHFRSLALVPVLDPARDRRRSHPRRLLHPSAYCW
jgi:hypothetical protein